MTAPTSRQLAVLAFVERYRTAHGYAPAVRDICEALGFRSTNAAAEHLAALEKKGLVLRDEFRARALVTTAAGLRWLGEA